MTSISRSLWKGLSIASFAFFLSSCANVGNFNNIIDFNKGDSGENSASVTEDDELAKIDSETCLNDELMALGQTGDWDEKSPSANSRPINSAAFDFPVVMNNKVNTYLNLFQTKQRKQFGHWLARSAIYRPMMEQELEKAGLPKDLVYLAMIESGYNQLACSSAKAMGLWQFMQPTGKQYDLQVDKYVDERRDPLKSTQAAVTYLSDLYKEFDDWYLAVAAYNGGPGTIRNGLKKHNVDNFWDLAAKEYLSLETKRYVPKLIAALLIAKEPEYYGFTDIPYHEPLRYDTITVGPGTSLDAIALISNSTTKEIQRLNQELRLGKTPLDRNEYEVKIPEKTAELATKNLSRLHSFVSTDYKTHKISKGDTLSKISARYGVNKTTILKVNNLHNGKLADGRNLRIPYNTITYQLLPEGSTKAMAAYKDSLILHRIKPGDTVSKISKQYNVPTEMIVGWNGLKSVHSIRAGQQLALYIDHGGQPKAENRTAAVASFKADKQKAKMILSEKPYQWYNVQNGDTLWTISRKFSASTADIKKWNNLKSDLIHPGSQLKLKKV
jgi:membrane-bound lytic murein transglycosylase D